VGSKAKKLSLKYLSAEVLSETTKTYQL